MKLRLILLLTLFVALLNASQTFKTLKVQGNHAIKTNAIYDALALPRPSWYEFWKKANPKINPKIANSFQETLSFYYRSQGFYHTIVNKNEDNQSITFTVKEGKAVHVTNITIDSDININKFITFKKGNRFIASKFVEIKKKIKEYLLIKGYCNADLKTKAYVDIKKNSVALYYKLEHNHPCIFGKTSIHPPKGISKKVVFSRLLFREGDNYTLDKIKKSYSTLSGLEAFDGIQLSTKKEKNRIDTDIILYAKQHPTRREIGIGYESNYGLKTFLKWNRKNFQGDARKLSFDMKYSKKERFLKNEFFWPAFLKVPNYNYYLDFKNVFVYSHLTFENFQEKKLSETLHLLKDYDWFSIDTGLGIEKIKIKKFKDVCNISAGDFYMFYPFAQIILDFRDSKINPKKGFYASQYFEAGLHFVISDATYIKSLSEIRAIYTLNKFTIALKSKLGFLSETQNKVPESKLFYAGGAFSNRAYGYNTLGAFDANCGEVGGRTMIDNSVEISHPLYKKLDIAFFWDSTLLSARTLEFNLDFKHGIGTGLRYNTLIGPIKFDVGMDLENHSQYALHFQIGQSF